MGMWPRKKDRTGQDRTAQHSQKKSQSGNISPIWGEAPTVPMKTKICMVGYVIERNWLFHSDTLPTLPVIFTRGQKVRNLAFIFDPTRLWAVRVSKWNKISKVMNKTLLTPMIAYVLPNFGTTTPEKTVWMFADP